MKKTSQILFILCACILACQAYELREWEDVSGNRVTGRFIRELFGKLAVEGEDGTETTLSIGDLSDVDKKYIRVMIPPKIEAVVRDESRRLPKRPADLTRDDIEDDYFLVAEILKKSQRPFTSRLNIETFLIADEHEADNYIVLGHFTDDFLLVQEKDYSHTYRSPAVRCTLFSQLGNGQRKGEDFKGHVFIITSMQGNEVFMHSNLPRWMQAPNMLKRLREISVRGAASVRSRHFNKDGEKVTPPRPKHSPLSTR